MWRFYAKVVLWQLAIFLSVAAVVVSSVIRFLFPRADQYMQSFTKCSPPHGEPPVSQGSVGGSVGGSGGGEDAPLEPGSGEGSHEPAPEVPRTPIVFCPGFLSPRRGLRDHYWGSVHTLDPHVLFVAPSGVASVHDRACAIFYEIKGGKTFFGFEHARKFGHAVYGDSYERGLFPEWSAERPVHLVGHSLGGNTVRALQHLLAIKFFPGHDTCADWVKSVVTVSSPLNGALATYALGACVPNHLSPRTRVLSPGYALGAFIHAWEFLDLWWLRNTVFDFGMRHFGWSWHGDDRGRVRKGGGGEKGGAQGFSGPFWHLWPRQWSQKGSDASLSANDSHTHTYEVSEELGLGNAPDTGLEPLGPKNSYTLSAVITSISKLAGTFMGHSPCLHEGDNAAYDLTMHAAVKWNRDIRTNKRTHYLAVVNKHVKRPRLCQRLFFWSFYNFLRCLVKHTDFSQVRRLHYVLLPRSHFASFSPLLSHFSWRPAMILNWSTSSSAAATGSAPPTRRRCRAWGLVPQPARGTRARSCAWKCTEGSHKSSSCRN